MGVHPFGDPAIMDDFSVETVPIDAREFHVYAAEWNPDHITFFLDGRPVKVVEQSPAYPMQLMLGIYEFRGDEAGAPGAQAYPKEFVVDYVRGSRRRS
jgi:beta-glucanase (GH16 family)